MVENTNKVVIRVILVKKKKKIYKIQTLVMHAIHVIH